MRRQFFFLAGMFLASIAQADLYSARGFKAGMCYAHQAKIRQNGSDCFLELFSGTKAQLNFTLDSCGREINPNTWYRVRFKLVQKQKTLTAKMIAKTTLPEKMADVLNTQSNGLAQIAICK